MLYQDGHVTRLEGCALAASLLALAASPEEDVNLKFHKWHAGEQAAIADIASWGGHSVAASAKRPGWEVGSVAYRFVTVGSGPTAAVHEALVGAATVFSKRETVRKIASTVMNIAMSFWASEQLEAARGGGMPQQSSHLEQTAALRDPTRRALGVSLDPTGRLVTGTWDVGCAMCDVCGV